MLAVNGFETFSIRCSTCWPKPRKLSDIRCEQNRRSCVFANGRICWSEWESVLTGVAAFTTSAIFSLQTTKGGPGQRPFISHARISEDGLGRQGAGNA